MISSKNWAFDDEDSEVYKIKDEIYKACKSNDANKLKELLASHNAIIIETFDKNFTISIKELNNPPYMNSITISDPIDTAISSGSFDSTKALIEDSDIRAYINPFHYIKYFKSACKFGKLPIVNYLLFDSKVNFMPYDEACPFGIKIAVQNGNLGLIKYFRNLPGRGSFDIRKENMDILHQACEDGSLDIVQYIFQEPKVDNFQLILEEFESRFKQACLSGSDKLIKFFIFDLNIPFTDYIQNSLDFIFGSQFSDLDEKKKIEDWFQMRTLKDSLSQELDNKTTNHLMPKKSKL
jgi:hypothetical protein